jgi:RHS repeat-associated protein
LTSTATQDPTQSLSTSAGSSPRTSSSVTSVPSRLKPGIGLVDAVAANFDYGWLGQHQRPAETEAGISTIEMGARPYVPGLGRFLQVDPIEGGSANDYEYSKGDCINNYDLDGRHATRGPHPPVDNRCSVRLYELAKFWSGGGYIRGAYWLVKGQPKRAVDAAGFGLSTDVSFATAKKVFGVAIGKVFLPITVVATAADANCTAYGMEWRRDTRNPTAPLARR